MSVNLEFEESLHVHRVDNWLQVDYVICSLTNVTRSFIRPKPINFTRLHNIIKCQDSYTKVIVNVKYLRASVHNSFHFDASWSF